jgi:hypothetical protein
MQPAMRARFTERICADIVKSPISDCGPENVRLKEHCPFSPIAGISASIVVSSEYAARVVSCRSTLAS